MAKKSGGKPIHGPTTTKGNPKTTGKVTTKIGKPSGK